MIGMISKLRTRIGILLKKARQWLIHSIYWWRLRNARWIEGYKIFARHEGLLETDIFMKVKVVFIGLGSLGGPIALSLARCGVARFVFIDPDRFDVPNMSRHPCGFLRNIGKFKTDIIADDIRGINPQAIISRLRLAVDWDTEKQIGKVIRGSDIVILTADSASVKSVVNKLCIEEKIPFLWAGCYRRAYGGQILRVIPDQSLCYECFRESLPDDDDHEISSARSANAPAYSDVEVKAEPGLEIDIAPIATMTSKLAVQMLLKDKESELHSLDDDLDSDFYMYFNRREDKAKDFIPMSDYVGGLRILSWIGVKMPRYKNCLCCGNPTFDSVLDTNSKESQILKTYNKTIGREMEGV